MVCHPPVPSSPLGYLLGLLGARSTQSYWSRRVGQPNMECCYSFDVSEIFTFNRPRSAVALSSSSFRYEYREAYATSSCILYELGWSRIQERILPSRKRGYETNFVLWTIVDNSYPWAIRTFIVLTHHYSEKFLCIYVILSRKRINILQSHFSSTWSSCI